MGLGKYKLGFANAVKKYGDEWGIQFDLLPVFDAREFVHVGIKSVDSSEAWREQFGASTLYRSRRKDGMPIKYAAIFA